MTISTSINKSGPYAGDGVNTTFAYNFKVFAKGELQVVRLEADGVTETTLVVDTDYTVNNVGSDTGTITYPVSGSPLSASETLTIVRDISFVQETDFDNQGGYYPQTTEDQFDRVVMMVQQLEEQVDRSVKLDVSDPDDPDTLLTAIDASVAAAAASAAAASGSETNAATSETNAATSETNAAASEAAAAVSETNAATSAALFGKNVKQFGAVGDGVTDDTVALQAALDSGGTLYLPNGEYVISSQLTIDTDNVALLGGGTTQSKIIGNFAAGDILYVGKVSGEIKNILLENFTVDSSVTKSSGAAVKLFKCVRSSIRGVFAAGQDGNGNIYDGYDLDMVDQIKIMDFEGYAINDCFRINGGGSGNPRGSNVFVWGGKLVSSAAYGVHVAGDVGGLYIDAADVNNCDLGGMLIDQGVFAGGNRQIFLGSGCYIDGESILGVRQQPGIIVNDLNLEDLMLNGTWLSVHTIGLHVQAASASTTRIKLNGCTNARCDDDAIRLDDTVRLLQVNGCDFSDCTGWGINSTVSFSDLGDGEGVMVSQDNRFRNCTAGDVTWDTIPPLPGTSFQRKISDDSFYSFTPRDLTSLGSSGMIMIDRINSGHHAIVYYRADPAGSAVTNINTSTMTLTTGALNGTTGVDGEFTVSAHTDEKIYLENRLGGEVTITVHLLGAHPGASVTGPAA